MMGDKDKWLNTGLGNIFSNPVYKDVNATALKNALPVKMSAVLLDFAKPLLDAVDLSEDIQVKSAIVSAIAAWNYSVLDSGAALPGSRADGAGKDAVPGPIRDFFDNEIGKFILSKMLARKDELYPDNRALILDFDLIWDEAASEFHLTVVTGG